MTDTLPINPQPWPLAADTIAGHWMQHEQRDGDRMCLVGGLEACGLAPGEWLIARAVTRHRGHGEKWNDASGRTEADVVSWLRSAEPITPGELAEVFGPQWEQVCALVLRAARLTGEEAQALRTTRAAAWDAAWAATRDATWEAARDATWSSTWPREAAWAATRDATWALTVRDLIGRLLDLGDVAPRHGFTQQHYDTLTGPWRKVIGPVHPDDAPLP